MFDSLLNMASLYCFSVKRSQYLTIIDLNYFSWYDCYKSDRFLLIDWIRAFTSEAIGENEPKPNYRDICDRRLRQNSLYLWQNDVPVSMAGFSGATPNGIRINAVYTPPEYRRKGYASSCVAALSRSLLNKGHKYCFLFTDLANPTSNSIYQKIGYKPVCDVSNYRFKN